jgi:hypothetical protein
MISWAWATYAGGGPCPIVDMLLTPWRVGEQGSNFGVDVLKSEN